MGRYIEEDENGNRYIVDDGAADATPFVQPPPFAKSQQLGPDYSKSIGANAMEGVYQTPSAILQTAEDAYNFAQPFDSLSTDGGPSGVIDTIADAGVEKTARTIGGLAAGTAGAAALAPLGAGWGSLFGPIGTGVGGVGGAALGFGAGLLGFDFANDAVSEGLTAATGKDMGGIRPYDQYLKDLSYNTAQGAVMGGTASAVAKIPRVNRALRPFTQEGAEVRVGQELNRMEPGGAPKIDRALVEQANNPFLENLPLGELLDNPVLKNQQRTIARSGSESYGKAAEAYAARNDAQLKYLDQIEPSTLMPEDVQSSIRNSVEMRQAASQRGLTAAEDAVGSAVSELPPPIDLVDAGSTIRQGISEGLNAQRGKVTSGFTGTGQGIVDTAPAKMVAANELPKYFREVGAEANSALTDLVGQLSREGQASALLDASGQAIIKEIPYTIKDIQALRSQAIEIVKGSDPRSAGVAGKIIGALDESVDNAIKSGNVTEAEAASWRAGVEQRKIQGEVYEGKTPSSSVLKKEYAGNYSVPDSAVPSKFWRPGEKGSRELMQNYKRAFGTAPEALEPIYRYAADSFRRAAVSADGTVNPKKARDWLKLHDEALKETPELKAQLQNVNEAQSFLGEKFGELKRSQAEVEKGALQLWLKDVEPSAAIDAMLSGKDMVKRTMSTVQYLKGNDADALAGLRRGVIEHIKKKAFIPDGKVSLEEASLRDGPRFDGSTKDALLKSRWETIKPALEKSKLFTDSQMQGFDYLYKDKASQLSVEKAKMPGGSDTAQNQSVLSKMIVAGSRGYLRTMPGGRFLSLIEPVLKTIPAAKYAATLEEALLNPRYARDLMNKASSKNMTKMAQTLFADEIAQAFGNKSPGEALVSGAKIAAPFVPVEERNKVKGIVIPKQNQVTSRKSFPSTKELLNPPATGSLKRTSLDVKSLVAARDPETRARVSVESSGNPFAVSPKGAQGLSQLMPATAQEIASELGEAYMPLRAGMTPQQQELSIDQNLRFGEHYYKKQLREFKNPTLARAAYNAGPGRVSEAIKMAGSSRDVNAILSQLPKGVKKETIPYVQQIATRYGNV